MYKLLARWSPRFWAKWLPRCLPTWSATLLATVALCTSAPGNARQLHAERSLYRNILVTEENGQVCLHFSIRKEQHSQSCRWTAQPRVLVFPYTRMMFASLLVVPHPQRILMVGLGGGVIPATLHELFPNAQIDIVEIDDAVLRVAVQYFAFKQAAGMTVKVSDARVFIKRALKSTGRYDLILLDAFNGDYIPEHLMTREFLGECNALLTPGGVLAANTFSTSQLYNHESATYRVAFGEFFNLKMGDSNNRVIIASNAILPDGATLARRATALGARLAPYHIDIEAYPSAMSRAVDWDASARILTDQYSPANLLRNQ